MPGVESHVEESATTAEALVRGKTAPTLIQTLRRRLLDLVVIAWVIAVGLTTGRQLVDWWREDPAAVPSIVRDAGEDWSRRPVEVRVGPHGVPLHRSPFVGNREAVDQRLMQLVQARLKDATAPTTPVDDAEQSLLERLKSELPIVPDHGRGSLYRWPAPWPGVIGTIPVDQQDRILAHGFAVPSGEDKWTLFVINGSTATTMLPLPPGAIPLLSWTDEAGRSVSTYRGRGTLTEWIAFWDQHCRDANNTVRDIRADSATLQYRRDEQVIDVQIQTVENDQLTGLAWTMPLSSSDALQSLPTDPLRSSSVAPQ